MIDTHTLAKGGKSITEFLNIIFKAYGMPENDFLEMADLIEATQYSFNGMVEELNSLFVAKVTVYFRYNVGVHPVIYLLAAILSKKVISRSWSKFYFSEIVKVPNDMIRLIAFMKNHNIGITNAVKKGFAKAFERYSINDLASSQNHCSEITLVDIVNIVHPQHNESLRKLISGVLPVVKTPCSEPIDNSTLKKLEISFEKNPKKIIDDICEINFR